MKKKLALLMCVVMLLGSLLVCIPTSAASANVPDNSNLAITEVCYAPKNEKYEFIEVVNVNTTGAQVNLKDYYIYRIAFSNSGAGAWHGTGAQKILGLNGQKANRFAYVSFEGLVGDDGNVVESAMLAPNAVAVIWFASASSKDESTANFKNYWSSRGADMDDTIVYKLPVYKLKDDGTPELDGDGNGINLWASNDTKYTGSSDGLMGVHHEAGSSFLPDEQAGVAFALIKKAYVDMELDTIEKYYEYTVAADGDTRTYNIKDVATDVTKNRLSKSDCVVYFMLNNKTRKDVSAHYYDFIDKDKFAAGAADAVVPEHIPKANRYIPSGSDLPSGLMVSERTDAEKENVYVLYDTTNTNGKATILPSIDLQYLSNPGKLYKGQLGIEEGEIPALDAANGEGSFVLNNYKEEVPSLAAGQSEEEGEEGDDTSATNTPTDTQAAGDDGEGKKGGCGSLVATSAMAVIAPVVITGCGITFKRKRK